MHAVHLMLKGGGYPFLELARKITEQIAPRS